MDLTWHLHRWLVEGVPGATPPPLGLGEPDLAGADAVAAGSNGGALAGAAPRHACALGAHLLLLLEALGVLLTGGEGASLEAQDNDLLQSSR